MEDYIKDPDAVLDYTFDWSNWLTGGETIATSQWVVPSGITKDSEANDTTTTTIWLSSGVAGSDYEITNRITTSGGRTDDRTFKVRVRSR